jgi:hypothetical protein
VGKGENSGLPWNKKQLDMKKNRIQIVGGIVVITLFIFLYIGSLLVNAYIDRDPIYVVGYINHLDASRSGLNVLFFYRYKNEAYYKGVTTLDINDRNNLIILKISRTYPSLWRLVDNSPPDCITSIPDIFNKSWQTFPKCNN